MRAGLLLSVALMAGCTQVSDLTGKLIPSSQGEPLAAADTGEPLAAPMEFEPLPEEEVKPPVTPVAEASPASGNSSTTVVSLGDPACAGAWMETPLVTAEQAGQVLHGGKGVDLTLIPSEGGSRLSLEAMQALGLPLSELTEVQVLF